MTIVDAVKKYMRVRYLPSGMDPARGLNCWGFVKCFMKEFDVEVVDLEDFVKRCPISEKARVLELYKNEFTQVDSPRALDIVLIEYNGNLHAGVCVGNGQFAHVSRAGFSVARLKEKFWVSKIIGFYRKVSQ